MTGTLILVTYDVCQAEFLFTHLQEREKEFAIHIDI